MNKVAVVCGAGGFIGGHMAKRLKDEGYWVRGVDLVLNEFMDMENICDEFILGDLRNIDVVKTILTSPTEDAIDVVYQFAADMGGAGYIFTGDNDADIMHNSGQINLHIASEAVKRNVKKVFYSSSACMYPEYNQMDPDNPKCSEDWLKMALLLMCGVMALELDRFCILTSVLRLLDVLLIQILRDQSILVPKRWLLFKISHKWLLIFQKKTCRSIISMDH